MRCFYIILILFTALSLSSCLVKSSAGPPAVDPTCTGFYGSPNGNTGLDANTCFPRIEGNQTWTPRVWDAAGLADLLTWSLDNPPPVLAADPYETTPALQPAKSAVCAVMVTGRNSYRLESFSKGTAGRSIAAAQAAGGIITHGGACGACSSLADLEVYARIPDQTDPVRNCGASHLGAPVEDIDSCIQGAVGFTPPCSRVWAYNVINDGRYCQAICITSLIQQEPYNLADGSLNSCLQCDEDHSGPVFKAVAGRTRRTSGLASAICRPCETVWRIDHTYR